MEGPYRDLGSGFARLTGAEGARRGPSRISCVEDALFELLRNARDAGARRIYVATTLRARRYRVLTVLDDGCGVPQGYEDLIFEPGVTTRHLDPVPDDPASPHGAGLSLYHLRNASLEARLLSSNSPTAIRAVFDTRTLPERSLQSRTRPSRSNIPATCRDFVRRDPSVRLYCSSPARILATLLHSRIIHSDKLAGVERRARDVGLE
ncbi:MAG: ATP-binding protein, partial [Actinomycetota bacterium]